MYTEGGKIVLVLNMVVMTVIYITITLEFVWWLNFKFCVVLSLTIVWFIYIGYYSIFYQTITGFRNINIEAEIVKQKTTNI